MEVNGAPELFLDTQMVHTDLFPTFFRISSFVFGRTNTFIQVFLPQGKFLHCNSPIFYIFYIQPYIPYIQQPYISVWYGNFSNQDCKALQRVVRLAEHISGSALPSLQDIYLKRCKSRAAKIIKDSTHPGNHLFCLLPSGKRFRSMMAKTERLRRSFFPQAIRLLNTNPVS